MEQVSSSTDLNQLCINRAYTFFLKYAVRLLSLRFTYRYTQNPDQKNYNAYKSIFTLCNQIKPTETKVSFTREA